MPQTTSLFGESINPVQIVALDSRKTEQVISDKQYIKILQISDLLSRHLGLKEILGVFSSEIKTLVPHDSYRYVSEQLSTTIRQGKVGLHSLHYNLSIQQNDLGALTIYRKHPFSTNELCQFEDLLCSLVYPLRNALMYQSAVTSAYRDPLTGINNRAAMDKLLPREVRLAKRHDHRLALMIMDLDGFKAINDSCGHDGGDQLLQSVAECIQHCLRDTDMVFRYGGDEFVAALPHTDIQGAIDVAERILNSIKNIAQEDCYKSIGIGMSTGLSMLHAGDDFSRFFKRVDQALYRAKKDGKHRVIVA
jgi:diguanylate cyclase (GGDEF)-like protein